MKQKTEIVLQLPEVAEFDVTEGGDMVLDGYVVNRNELQKMVGQSEKHGAAITAVYKKTRYGMVKMAEIDRHGLVTFVDTAKSILDVKNEAKGKQLRQLAEQYAERIIIETGNSNLQAIRIGKTWIQRIIHESPYPPEPERKPHRGLVWRWWYGDEE
jgi:hypothetical protein